MKTYFKIIFSILLFSLLIPLFTKAITFENPFEDLTFEKLIENIINFIFWVAMAIAPIMIIVAAFYFLTSGGNPEKVSTAKKIIFYTIIGLIIIFLAKGIPAIIRQIIEGPLPPCNFYSFQGGTVLPDFANPGDMVNTTCDYGASGIDCIESFIGPNECNFIVWDGTKAKFSCLAPMEPNKDTLHVCKLKGGTISNCCAQSDDNGSLNVLFPTCTALVARINAAYGSECGDASYDPIADVSKDKKVGLSDLVMLVGLCGTEACCQGLWDGTNPCP
jgi:hypothetical protein